MLDGGAFERAGTDTFKVDVVGQFSPLSKLIVGHDDDGLGAGWSAMLTVVGQACRFLDSVDIYSPVTGVTQHFECEQWLAK